MNLSRRGLLGGLAALAAAPAIVRVESLMQLPAPQQIIVPELILPETAVEDDVVIKDAQKMFSFNSSADVEFEALQNKTPWIGPLS